MRVKTIIAIVLFLFAFPLLQTIGINSAFGGAVKNDWPNWRGPNGNGKSAETGWNPKALKDGPKIAWKTSIGWGYSNVAIKGKYLYAIGHQGKEDTVYCLNARNGKEIWRYSYPSDEDPQATPAVDGNTVYSMSKSGHLFCLNARNGKVLWDKDLAKEWHVDKPGYGFAGSPVIVGELLILNANTSGAAIDKKTGDVIWISEPNANRNRIVSYSTPVIYNYKGNQNALIFSAIGLFSVDIDTGQKLWVYEWNPADICIADPIVFDNKVFISTGYSDTGSALMDIKGNEPNPIWKNRNMRNEFSSSVLVYGYIYGSDGKSGDRNSSLTCLDVMTGDVMWKKELGMVSLIGVNDKLIILTEKGMLIIAEAISSKYSEISSGKVVDKKILGDGGPILFFQAERSTAVITRVIWFA